LAATTKNKNKYAVMSQARILLVRVGQIEHMNLFSDF
jgi:hypothetical protein